MIVAIVGSREFPDRAAVDSVIAMLHIEWHGLGLKITSGGARGVDTWVAEHCNKSGIPFMEYPADWKSLGLRAGYARNEEMVKVADKVVAFWDGESKGTKHTIDLALKHRKDLEVHFP